MWCDLAMIVLQFGCCCGLNGGERWRGRWCLSCSRGSFTPPPSDSAMYILMILAMISFTAVCLDRQTGFISGYYYDPASAPYQYLQLQAEGFRGASLTARSSNHSGAMAFGSYDLR